MEEIQTAIFLDTNFLFIQESSDFNEIHISERFDNIIKIINDLTLKEYVEIIIPEIVYREISQQKIEMLFAKIKKCTNFILPGGKTFLDYRKESNLIKGYKKLLKKKKADILNNTNKISFIPLPKRMKLETIIDRAIEKKPPFKGIESESDKGFKDVLIWETILDYKYRNRSKKIILMTNDCDFNNKKGKEEDTIVPSCKQEFEKLFSDDIEIIDINQLRDVLEKVYEEYINKPEVKETKDLKEDANNYILSQSFIYDAKQFYINKFNMQPSYLYLSNTDEIIRVNKILGTKEETDIVDSQKIFEITIEAMSKSLLTNVILLNNFKVKIKQADSTFMILALDKDYNIFNNYSFNNNTMSFKDISSNFKPTEIKLPLAPHFNADRLITTDSKDFCQYSLFDNKELMEQLNKNGLMINKNSKDDFGILLEDKEDKK